MKPSKMAISGDKGKKGACNWRTIHRGLLKYAILKCSIFFNQVFALNCINVLWLQLYDYQLKKFKN